MFDRLISILTFVSALGAGVTTGIWFTFSVFVMAALAKRPAAEGIAAMQSINVTIINPTFLIVFLGMPALCVILAIAAFIKWGEPGMALLLAGALLYFVGVFLVTMVFNVPLNDALAAVDPASAEGAALWTRYLSVWTIWNHVRMIAGLTALAAFIAAFRSFP